MLDLDGTKISLHAERLRAFLAGERIAPITIDMALTQKCQMACVFCLPPQEPVLLANGQTKQISEIKIGDRIASFDGTELCSSTVTAQWKTRDKDRLLAIETPSGTIHCTNNHPILTQYGWIAASDLNIRLHYIASILHASIEGRIGPLEEKDAPMVGLACWTGEKTPTCLDVKKTETYQRGKKIQFGENEKEESHAERGYITKSPAYTMDTGRTLENVASHETTMGGRSHYFGTSQTDRKENEQNRIPVIGGFGADGFYIQRQRGFLDSGMPVWYGEKPRLYMEERKEENRPSDARPVLAHDAKFKSKNGNEGLHRKGMESIHSMGEKSSPEEASETRRDGSEVLVGWVPILSIKDAGYSPVYDLECYPHHNFIASGIVVHNCYANLQQYPSDPIPWKCYSDFLDDCVEIGHKKGEGVKAISLVSDGESTLNKDYYRFIEKAKINGIDIASGTNGEALKFEQMPLLADCLTYLRFNLNAALPKENARIMGTSENAFHRVIKNVREMVRVKHERNSKVSIGLQMVLMPSYKNQIVPLAKFGKELGVDYLIIKHCSDDEAGRLGVNYAWYTSEEATNLLENAEKESTENYSVQVKWSKIKTGRDREYSKCYGTALHLQMSGSGIVAPCGSFFHERYKRFHIGDIAVTRFREIWASQAYKDVIDYLKSEHFDPRKECATLCLQDRTNLSLFNLIEKGEPLKQAADNAHRNFL